MKKKNEFIESEKELSKYSDKDLDKMLKIIHPNDELNFLEKRIQKIRFLTISLGFLK